MNFGILSILPPFVAIILAVITKEVVTSLMCGILVGGLIFNHGQLLITLESVFSLMAEKFGENSMMILFLALLGSLVMVLNKSGGSYAYGKWASKKITSKRSANLATIGLGVLIFIDDYFNCLTVGTVMRPITDNNGISRAKLANIIDSTAALICILMPVSSWAASIVSIIADTGLENPMGIFVSTIPLNFYALITIFLMIYISFSDTELFEMEKYERNDTSKLEINADDNEHSDKGTVLDLIIPIVVLITFTIFMMLRTGGYFDGQNMADAFGDANVNLSLVLGSILAIVAAFLMYIPRKLMGFKDFMSNLVEGINSMVMPIVILTLAWTLGAITSESYLNTGGFIGEVISNTSFPIAIIPAITFLIACVLSFSTGTAWGTFGILVPIMVPILKQIGGMEYLSITLASVFSGSVFGDHCSPISDTTILSSAGAGCDHITHVMTQLPYALIAGGSALVGFLFGGFLKNGILSLAITVVFAIVVIEISKKKTIARYGEK